MEANQVSTEVSAEASSGANSASSRGRIAALLAARRAEKEVAAQKVIGPACAATTEKPVASEQPAASEQLAASECKAEATTATVEPITRAAVPDSSQSEHPSGPLAAVRPRAGSAATAIAREPVARPARDSVPEVPARRVASVDSMPARGVKKGMASSPLERLSLSLQELSGWLQSWSGQARFDPSRSDRARFDGELTALQRELEAWREPLRTAAPLIHFTGGDPLLLERLSRWGSESVSDGVRYVQRIYATPDASTASRDGQAPEGRWELVATLEGEKRTLRIPLTPGQATRIGRDPAQHLSWTVPERCNLVSGIHLEVTGCAAAGALGAGWMVRDLQSRNGTYIDGVRLEQPRRLFPGDRLLLGASTPLNGTLELCVESTVSPRLEAKTLHGCVSCDGLVLVLPAWQLPSKAECQLIEKARQGELGALIVLLVAGEPGAEIPAQVRVGRIETVRSALGGDNSLDVRFLCLPGDARAAARSPGISEDALDPALSQLLHSFQTSTFSATETSLLRRGTCFMQRAFAQAEAMLSATEMQGQLDIRRLEQAMTLAASVDLKERSKKLLKSINEDRDRVFRQLKTDLSLSKSAMLSEHLKRGIQYQAEQFVTALEPQIQDREGVRYVQLGGTSHLSHLDLHAQVVLSCKADIERWTELEWQKLVETYADGGLRNLLGRLDCALSELPDARLEPMSRQQLLHEDFRQTFRDAVAEVPFQEQYERASLPLYILKKVRAHLMSVGMFIMLLAMIGLSGVGRDSVKLGVRAVSDFMLPILGNPGLAMAFSYALVLVPLVVIVMNGWVREEEQALEAAVLKLREEVQAYYFSLSKGLLERVGTQLTMALEMRERQLKDNGELIQESAMFLQVKADQKLGESKSELDRMRQVAKGLEKDRQDLAKVKR